ncbi:MAG: DUF1571 domain-containing protein [Gemmataceae bacterium]
MSDFPQSTRSTNLRQLASNTQVPPTKSNRGGVVLSLDTSGNQPPRVSPGQKPQRQGVQVAEEPPPPAPPGFSQELDPRRASLPLPTAPPEVQNTGSDDLRIPGVKRPTKEVPPAAALSLEPIPTPEKTRPRQAPKTDLPPPIPPRVQLEKQGKPESSRVTAATVPIEPPPTAVTERRMTQQDSNPDNRPLGGIPDLPSPDSSTVSVPPPVSPHKQLKPLAYQDRRQADSEPENNPLPRRNVVALSPRRPTAPPEKAKTKRLVPRPLPVNGLQPVNHAPPGKPAGNLKSVHQLAAEGYASIDSYIVKFRRREVVGGRKHPEELMLFKFRKKPWSTYFKWLGGAGKGRECVYVKHQHGNKIYTKTAAGDIPLVPAGNVIALAPDSPLVRSKSRRPITSAGIGYLIDKFGTLVGLMERRDFRRGTLRYLGLVRRPEFKKPVEAVLQVIPPQAEKSLPQGGRRFWYFDTKLRFPVLIITQDVRQREVEYYCFERFLFPGRLSDEEFDPKALWGE